MAGLRHIALYVDEVGGSFLWVLMERPGESAGWVESARASRGVARYDKALAAGLRKLETLAEDPARGPVRQLDAKPAATPAKAARKPVAPPADEDQPARQRGPYFGFGPAK